MKLEIGMYVRTPKGIAKVTSMYAEPNRYIVYTDKDTCFEYYLNNECKWVADYINGKPSFRTVDLIQVGDYVNGYKITSIQEIEEPYYPKRLLYVEEPQDYVWQCFNNDDIESIVTKEQYESVSYEVK